MQKQGGGGLTDKHQLAAPDPRAPLTFTPPQASIPQEHRMGNMGLALAWEARMPRAAQRERRLEPFREQIAASDRGADAGRLEDTPLAEACRTGDLRAYERLYSLHGARMKNLARNILGSVTDAEDA